MTEARRSCKQRSGSGARAPRRRQVRQARQARELHYLRKRFGETSRALALQHEAGCNSAMRPEKTPAAAAASTPAFVRLDIWLWATRFFKTRSLAKQAIESGKVEVNDAAGRPSRPLHVGDRVRLARGEEHFAIEVVALCERRASAPVAQRCYRETEASRASRLAAAEQRRLVNAGYSKPASKPDKRARRLIRALGDIDAF